MLNSEFKENTSPLLRQDQVKESENEIKRLKGMVENPLKINGLIQDKMQVQGMLRNITKDLETQRPAPYDRENLDSAVNRERTLREKFVQGMPTAAEMRKSPPGVLQKNIEWEKRNKQVIAEWKNIRKRLHASGDLEKIDRMDAYGVSNVEMFRPIGGSQEANMDNAFIPGKDYHMQHVPSTVVFTDDELAALKELAPDLAAKVASMTSEQRQGVKEILDCMPKPGEPEEKTFCAKEECNNRVKEKGGFCRHHHQPDAYTIDVTSETED